MGSTDPRRDRGHCRRIGLGKSITAQSAMKLLPEETAMYTNGHHLLGRPGYTALARGGDDALRAGRWLWYSRTL